MISTYQDALIPPLCTLVQPNNALRIKFEWFKYKLKRKWDYLLSFDESSWGLTKRALKKLNRTFDYSLLNWDKCFHVGIKNVPEWVMSPSEFDFPKQTPLSFQHHIGPTIDLNRKEIQDPHFDNFIKTIAHKKIAYCSLGTISVTHNKNGLSFLRKAAEVFSIKKDWALIISCGEIDINELGFVAPNVHLFKRVPQLTVIQMSEFVITHAGLNTVLECVLIGKPMLAFPLNDKWDQNGIATRVVYHKIGLMGNINTITTAELMSKVNELITNQGFKENVSKMSVIFQKHSDNLENVINF